MSILAAVLSASVTVAGAPIPAETYIEAKGPSGPLKGTMVSPATPDAPIVLIIPGSGPIDRDGNSPAGLKARSLKLLAEGLAANGIASVRIDKRGMYASAAAIPNANAVTIGDYASDVHAWATAIRRRSGANCIWVLGHSEGGLVALAAGRDSADICGLILVSTAGRPLGAVLAEQLKSNPANTPILDQALSAIATLEGGQHVEPSNLHPALLPLFSPAVQNYLIDAMAQDPAKLIAAFPKPVLILQGERDIQVGVHDAQLLKQAAPTAKLVLLRDTNHVLKTVTSDARNANIATYADPSLPLAPGVVPSIAAFITTSRR
ncbi:alpha/beta hydrolase [Sphingomonas qilianensis]|uniref:Alpha/beta fold hydrolase n=1 Tax=Sphingomonas qilianensis TaxID=1736690 RepID=A0ABU9XQL3_9SPHN